MFCLRELLRWDCQLNAHIRSHHTSLVTTDVQCMRRDVVHYDDAVFAVGVGAGIAVGFGVGVGTVVVVAVASAPGVAVGAIVGATVGIAVGVETELEVVADALWSVSCQRLMVMMPTANAAATRNPYFCLFRLCVTSCLVTGIPRGGVPPDSIVIFPCGSVIHPSTMPLLSSDVVRKLLPGFCT